MVQPKNRRFVMEDRLDADRAQIDAAIATKITNPAQTANIADGAITSAKIADGTIVAADLASNAVTTVKIADGAITTAKLADGAVVTVDIADGAVTSAKIADGTIVDADVNASAAIAKTKIAGTAVTLADTGTVTSTMIADGTIVNADVNASAAIAASKIAGTAVTLADTGTVTSTMIADGTIVNADISTSAAIAITKLASSSITMNGTAVSLGGSFTTPMPMLEITAGNQYQSAVSSPGTVTAANLPAGRLFATPFFVANASTAVSLSMATSTTFTTAGTARVGIYNNTNGAPGTRRIDGGTISFTAASTAYQVTISHALPIGWYWLVGVIQTGAATFVGYGTGTSNGSLFTQLSFGTTSSNGVMGYYTDGVTGALPSTATWTPHNLGSPMVKIGF